ncbi:MAG: ABC transporter ATP-binding protein [Bacteroidales bacterium]
MIGLERDSILTVHDLEIGYRSGRSRNVLLPPVTASASVGELIAVIGENGIGKSTFLRTITGLQESLGGSVSIKGKSLLDYRRQSLALNIGYISTEPVRVQDMRVYDLVALGRHPHTDWTGRLGRDDWETVEKAIQSTGLQRLRNRNINELSDGERQRAMIARVLAQDTDILVMDEPTAFLDIKSRYEIIHLLHDLARNRSKTIIFSTHDFNIAAADSDKIWLFLGEGFTQGAPEDLILDGVIDRLFGDSIVSFNKKDGSFSFSRGLRGNVQLLARGMDAYWTGKALNRAGFGVSQEDTGLRVTVESRSNRRTWKLSGDKYSEIFCSVYDLVKWLNTSWKEN